MITVKRDNNSISVQGHANYGKRGEDVVCAGVSTLAQTLIESIETLTADNIKCHRSAGNIVINHGDLSEKSKLLINSFFIGVFPENVQVELFGNFEQFILFVQALMTLKAMDIVQAWNTLKATEKDKQKSKKYGGNIYEKVSF